MPYNEDTPANINESFSTSQPKITANFKSIKTVVEQDHEAFDSDDEGKHKQVLFTQQGAATSTSDKEVALYAKDNGGSPNLYLRLKDDGTEFNITPVKGGNNSKGHVVLPSGVIINWGNFIVANGSQGGSQTFNEPYSASPSITLSVKSPMTSKATDNVFVVNGLTNSTVTVTRNAADTGVGVTVHYMAIGV